MMPACSFALAIAMIAQADAPPMPDPHVADAARTVELNAAVRRQDDEIDSRNAGAAAAYAAELARYHEAEAANAKARARANAAADSYRRDRAGYEAAMARWQADRAARANADRTPPKPRPRPSRRIVCENVVPTGTTITQRVCHEE